MFRDVMVHGERVPPGEAHHMMQGMLECSIFFEFIDAVMRDGGAADLDQISCPVRIAWCEEDTIFPVERYSQTFGTVPGVEVTRLPGCGHVPMYDAPELVARTIGEFSSGSRSDQPAAVAT